MAGFTVSKAPLVESGFLVPECVERSLKIVIFPNEPGWKIKDIR